MNGRSLLRWLIHVRVPVGSCSMPQFLPLVDRRWSGRLTASRSLRLICICR